jgi:hypothetical protein
MKQSVTRTDAAISSRMSVVWQWSALASATILLCSLWMTTLANAAEIQIFSNEQGQENANTFILDSDDTGGDVQLQFGGTLNEQLYWDNAATQFVFTDDLNVQGDIDVDGTITAGSGNIQLTDATGNLDGEVLIDDSVDDDSIDFGMGADQVGADDLTMTDNFTNSDSTDVQNVTEDIDAAIGDRTFSEDNFVTDGESVADSIDALDSALNSLTGTSSNSYILDNDDTGGDVTLQFGASLNETLVWSSGGSTFVLSDDLNIQGNADVDGIITAGSSNIAITNAAGNLDGSVLAADTVDDAAIDFGMGAGQVGGDDITVTDTFDNSNNTNVQGVLDDVDAAVGDRSNFTEQNFITNNEAVASSLDALDVQVQDNADALSGDNVKSMLISMNDLTVTTDGTNNISDLFTDYDQANDRQFYILKTQQSSLQDLDLRFKVKLPEDFKDWTSSNDLRFSYRNTGSDNTDSRIDILVEDADGDAAFTAADGQNLFSAAWTDYTDEFDGGAFDPAAGDFIYVTVKGYTSNDSVQQNPYIGEIVLTYNSNDVWAN